MAKDVGVESGQERRGRSVQSGPGFAAVFELFDILRTRFDK